jgi:Amt family ammonium transporter
MKKLFSKFSFTGLISLLMLGFSQVVVSEEISALVEQVATINSGDTAWMIVATILVIIMAIPGLALFYGGLVRSKNMLSVLMQVFTTFSLMSVLWVVYGYSMAFTEGPYNAYVGGLSCVLKWHYCGFSFWHYS